MKGTRTAALALTATALAISGCGGSGSSGKTIAHPATSAPTQTTPGVKNNTPSRPPLTDAALIAKADAICTHLNKMNSSIRTRKPEDYKRSFLVMAGYERTAVASLNALVPPASVAGDWNKLLEDAKTVAENTAKVGKYALSGDINAARSLLDSGQPTLEEMRAIARRNGLKACALAA